MDYNELLTELSVIRAFISKFKNEKHNTDELEELKEQEDYLIEQISNVEFDNCNGLYIDED